jgi:hypothetical protein
VYRYISVFYRVALRAFEKRVPRRIFGPKMDEVTGEWGKFHRKNVIICIRPQISLGRSSEIG